MSAITATDPTRCPLCAQLNQCAMELENSTGLAQPPCWCTTVHFDADLLAQVPEAARRQACICQSCATRANKLTATP